MSWEDASRMFGWTSAGMALYVAAHLIAAAWGAS